VDREGHEGGPEAFAEVIALSFEFALPVLPAQSPRRSFRNVPMTFAPSDYLDLNHTEHRMLFENSVNAWEALKQIQSYLQFRLKPQILDR
jgi:hypothetical protein